LDSLLRSAIDDDIDIVLNLEDGLLPVSADPNQLESSLLNLALNARDAMPDGGRLVISATNLPLGAQAILGSPDGSETLVAERYVMLEVSDDGTGMPSEVLSRAFEPFFTTKDVGEGTGLGLSMVYGFARQSNGYVTLVSEPGLGTSARLYLPSLPEPVKATAAERVQEETAASKVAAGRSLMVVEDDTLVRAYMVNCLSSLGYRVLSCSNGREALAVLSSGQPLDLVVTDTVMPGGVSGIEVVDRAKSLRPDLPVLLTSGYAVESLAAKGRYRPSTPFLPKPFSRDELANAVAKLIVDAGRKQGVENVERMS
jgi:CheY-like chemotaxis protein